MEVQCLNQCRESNEKLHREIKAIITESNRKSELLCQMNSWGKYLKDEIRVINERERKQRLRKESRCK